MARGDSLISQAGQLNTAGPYVDTLGAAESGFRTAATAVTATDLADGDQKTLLVEKTSGGTPTGAVLVWSATWDNGNSRWTRTAEELAISTISNSDPVRVSVAADPNDRLVASAQTMTTGDLDIEPGYSYEITCSGITADRYLNVKAGTAGDEAAILLMTDADTATDAYELVYRGDTTDSVTLNGVAAGTEVSRLLLTNETLQLRWITATAVTITHDGRLPTSGHIHASGTAQDTNESANTLTENGNLQTAAIEVGMVAAAGSRTTPTASTLTVRRAGDYVTNVAYTSKNDVANTGVTTLRVNADENFKTALSVPQGGAKAGHVRGTFIFVDETVGTEFSLSFKTTSADVGVGQYGSQNWLQVIEQL